MMYFAPFFLLLFRLFLETNNLNGKTRHDITWRRDDWTWFYRKVFLRLENRAENKKIRKERKENMKREKNSWSSRRMFRGCLEVFYPTFKIKFHFICSHGVKIEKESTMTYIWLRKRNRRAKEGTKQSSTEVWTINQYIMPNEDWIWSVSRK